MEGTSYVRWESVACFYIAKGRLPASIISNMQAPSNRLWRVWLSRPQDDLDHDWPLDSLEATIEELTKVGERYNVAMPACNHIYKSIKAMHGRKEAGPAPSTVLPKVLKGQISAPFRSERAMARTALLVLSSFVLLWALWLAVDVVAPRRGPRLSDANPDEF